nr:MAG TPA: hypothetical protein [Caudoviricetes sp.]
MTKLHFHWKFNIGKFEKSFSMKWLLFYLIKRRWLLIGYEK